MALGNQVSIRNPVFNAVRQQQQSLGLDGSMIKDPEIGLLLEFPPPIEGHPGIPRTPFDLEGAEGQQFRRCGRIQKRQRRRRRETLGGKEGRQGTQQQASASLPEAVHAGLSAYAAAAAR